MKGKAMKKLAMTIVAVITIAVVMMFTIPARSAEVEGFYQNFAEAQKEAKKLDKPLFLHFTTTWCGWCRKIENDIYKTKEGKEALKGFVCASLDCTVPEGKTPPAQQKANLEMMAKYGGDGYPFLVMVTPDGVLLNSFAGYKPMSEFKKELTKALANWKKHKAFEAYAVKADKKSYEYNKRALDFYSKTGAWDKAAQAAGLIEKQVKKEDPKNRKGLLEKVLWAKALDYYQQGDRAKSKAAGLQSLRNAAKTLKELTLNAEKLSNAKDVYALLGFSQAALGQFDDAIASYEKLLAMAPKGPEAKRIEQMINTLKKEKAKMEEKGKKENKEKK